jgi:hypothetical protein
MSKVSETSEGTEYDQRTSLENLAMHGYRTSDGIVSNATACVEY